MNKLFLLMLARSKKLRLPTIYRLKPAFQNLLRPLVRSLVGIGATANQVTIAAAVISIAAGIVIYFYREIQFVYFLLPAVFFVRMALNAIDGMLAREFNMKSNLGAILNELGDVISDAALYLPFALIFSGYNSYLIVFVTFLAVISEMTGVVAVQIGSSRRYDGPMGKSDRAFVFGLLAFFMGFGMHNAAWFPKNLFYALVLVALLLAVTIYNRIINALQEAR